MDTAKYTAELDRRTIPVTRYTVFVPLFDREGNHRPDVLEWAKHEITRHIGGLTAKAPSTGLWIDQSGTLCSDSIVPIECDVPLGSSEQAEYVSREWFASLGDKLAKMLNHRVIFITAEATEIITHSSVPLWNS